MSFDDDSVVYYISYAWLFLVFIPQNESHVTLQDLKGSKLSGNVFNILFNLNKFMAFETRDPFLIRQVLVLSDIKTLLLAWSGGTYNIFSKMVKC